MLYLIMQSCDNVISIIFRTSVRSLTTMRRTLHKSASAHGTVNGLQPEVEHAANPRKVINLVTILL